MDGRLVTLRLVLKELGISPSIESLDDRLAIQKGVCLAQAAGLGLGYHHSWYVHGPYSPRLTKDYYELSDALAVEGDVTDRSLRRELADNLAPVAAVVSVPRGVDLPQARWLELLTSYLYLRRSERLPRPLAIGRLGALKPRLARYVDVAERSLIEAGLLAAN